MNQRIVLVVSAISTAALALAVGTILIASVARLNLESAVFGGVIALFLIGCLAGVAAWLLGMMEAARLSRWDWFIEVLALGPLGALIFALVGSSAWAPAPSTAR